MKIFRDPIHNVINLDTGNKSVNDLIIGLIDSREFQRLHFIKQLGFTYFAYPSATHTRFEHSLGVAFLAKRFLDRVISLEEESLKFCAVSDAGMMTEFFHKIKASREVTIVAALLHDIGHGPLSHTTEGLTSRSHEEWGRDVILGNTEVNRLLMDFDEAYPAAVCDILSGEWQAFPSSGLISGRLDVDRMDYLLRDSHMTGSRYGEFDIEWMLNVLTIGVVDYGGERRVEIGLDLGKGLSIAENFVMARIYMFKNVYLHKSSLIAHSMLRLLFNRIRDLSGSSPHKLIRNIFPGLGEGAVNVFSSYVGGGAVKLEDYLSVSDVDLFCFFKALAASGDEVLQTLANGMLHRHMFKEISPEHKEHMREFIIAQKGVGMENYYMAEVGLGGRAKKLSYQPKNDKIFLFGKNKRGYELLDKSGILPTQTASGLTDFYVEAGVLKSYSL